MNERLARLAGVWRGEGEGSYPKVGTFRYLEELRLEPTEWNMLHVLQQTWRLVDGAKDKPLHLETGLIIAREDGTLVYSCAQDSGRTEVMSGQWSTARGLDHIAWTTIVHGNDERLVRVGRDWWCSDETLAYAAYLATVETPDYRKHLEARLDRTRTLGSGSL